MVSMSMSRRVKSAWPTFETSCAQPFIDGRQLFTMSQGDMESYCGSGGSFMFRGDYQDILSSARRRVVEGEKRVVRMKDLIADAEGRGEPTEALREARGSLEAQLFEWQANVQIIEIAYTDALLAAARKRRRIHRLVTM